VGAVKGFLAAGGAAAVELVQLPGYAPELNPVESCNNCVKLAMLNAVPRSDTELRAAARLNFQRLGRKPHLLRHCFEYGHLSVTYIQGSTLIDITKHAHVYRDTTLLDHHSRHTR
jgi:hypothetical protein